MDPLPHKQIFDSISSLIASEDFRSAQMEFVKQKCGVFEDTDENKLEYTPIYEEYLALVEQAIEG